MSCSMRNTCVSMRWFIKLVTVVPGQVAVLLWQHNFALSLM
jgi:hypothetical protein